MTHRYAKTLKQQPGKLRCVSLALFFFLVPSYSAARPQSVAQDSADQAAVERGRKQFGQSCGFCHGPDATGARGPDLVRSPLVTFDVMGNQGRADKIRT